MLLFVVVFFHKNKPKEERLLNSSLSVNVVTVNHGDANLSVRSISLSEMTSGSQEGLCRILRTEMTMSVAKIRIIQAITVCLFNV